MCETVKHPGKNRPAFTERTLLKCVWRYYLCVRTEDEYPHWKKKHSHLTNTKRASRQVDQ
jgi:hypothetical protein